MKTQILMIITLAGIQTASAVGSSRDDVIQTLNTSEATTGPDEAKSWKIFFDGCLEISPPPQPVTSTFNMNTIWPGMAGWSDVVKWAEDNEHMRGVFIQSSERPLVGLPYGIENVPDTYQAKDIVAEIGVDNKLHIYNFGYVEPVKLACLWATAELYRLFELEESDSALELLMAEFNVLRKFCDREFVYEQITFMSLLSDALTNARDMLYTYNDNLTANQCRFISKTILPSLRTDPARLLLPEGDHVVSEALIRDLFTSTGDPNPVKFKEVLTDIQIRDEPITRLGASKYWMYIALNHRGRDDSIDRLNRIYDDWWRRWKMRAFHPLLSVDSELQLSNQVTYAAVNLVAHDLQGLFYERDLLSTQINGTAVVAALCGYKNHFGVYPRRLKLLYAILLNRTSNLDLFNPIEMRSEKDWELYVNPAGKFHYRILDKKTAVRTKAGDIVLDKDQCLLYSVFDNNEDDRGLDAQEDLVFWPSLRVLERNAGLLD
jgi:hypothetical protein